MLPKLTLLAAPLAVILTLIGAPAPAHADSDDDTTYLTAIHNRGLEMKGGDQEFITFGHKVCAALAEGYSMNALMDAGDLHERNGVSDDDVKFMVKAAAATYCPAFIQ